MKKAFRYFFLFFNMILFCNQGAFASRQAMEDILIYGCRDLPYADLNFEDLDHCNLDGLKIPFAWLDDTNFKKSSLKWADLSGAYAPNSGFRWANLEGANLSGANFTGALFFGANLKNAKAEGAIFESVRGLTNEQKADLKKKKAKKVPIDLSPKKFEEERLQVEKEIKSSIAYRFNKLFKRLFRCRKNEKGKS